MNKRIFTALLFMGTIPFIAGSCSNNLEDTVSSEKGERIVFNVTGGHVLTKTAEVSAVPSQLCWAATSGSGSETVVWGNSGFVSVAGGRIDTGKYLTIPSSTPYNYYVSNESLTVGSTTSISAANTRDVVCGRTVSNEATPTVVLNHVFSRTGTLTFDIGESEFVASNVVWHIESQGASTGTAGTYNLTTGSWSATTTLPATEIKSATAANFEVNSLYLIPGDYTVTVDFVLTKDGKSLPFSISGKATMLQGRTMNMTATFDTLNIDDSDWENIGGGDWNDGWEEGGETPLG